MFDPGRVEEFERQLGDPVAPPAETRPELATVESVEEHEGAWEIGFASGAHFLLGRDRLPWRMRNMEAPHQGDTVVLYTCGSMMIGVDLRGERLYLESEREYNAGWLKFRARQRREQHEQFERDRESLDAEYEQLPDVFQQRIDRRRANNPDFRERFESYEMFCCCEAVKLAERATAMASRGLSQEVRDFWADPEKLALAAGSRELPWEDPEDDRLRWLWWTHALNSRAYDWDYKRHIAETGLSHEHSGNTASCAYTLARIYLTEAERVPDYHGALVPFVGSREYGDVGVPA